jgi:CRP-like cAMP-binding protein
MGLKKRTTLNCHTCIGRTKGIFCNLKGASLDELDESKNSNIYKKGQNLFVEGNPAFGLFCIHSGKVKITKSNSEGSETIVRIVTSGDLVGHRSLFSDSPYAASATVIEEGTVCFVSKETIKSLIEKEPPLAFEIINRLSKEMGIAEEKLASMARKSVRERFAEMLLLLKENFGVKNETGILLDIKLTREEMSQMVGAASENIIRLITDFKELGYIAQNKKQIILLNIKAIEKEAALGF